MYNPGEAKGFYLKSFYLRPLSNLFMNVVQLPVPDLPLGTVPETPRSDGKIFCLFTYIWQEDVAIIPKVPGAPRIVILALAITRLAGATIYCTIFQ